VHARVTTMRMDPDRVDEVTRILQADDIPGFRELEGFKGITVLTDRGSGKTVAVTFWESEEALKQSEEAVEGARQRAADTGGAPDMQIERFEVVLDSLL
jgi:heme-degrading monooxygenase HmoA